MNPVSPTLPRRPFQGMIQILQFNWPFYATAAVVCAVGAAGVALLPLPGWLRGLGLAGVAGAGYFSGGSLLASWWVYDHSPLGRWNWIADLLPDAPRHWANIHAGLDESSLALRRLFPASTFTVLDIYDPATMTEPAIVRARARMPAPVPALPATPGALPLADGTLDTVFLIFAAHEIRDPALRERFFGELRRVLAAGGQVLLVEHVRDLANFAVFGPGFWHFLPRAEWLRLAAGAGLRVAAARRITPFVRVWVFEKS
jgi:SAM-dependent methyltransferase